MQGQHVCAAPAVARLRVDVALLYLTPPLPILSLSLSLSSRTLYIFRAALFCLFVDIRMRALALRTARVAQFCLFA